MARASAKATAAKGTGPAQAKGSVMWIQGLACGALLTFATPTAFVLAVLLAPAWACAIGERGHAQGMARAVALCCAAAALSPLWHLWLTGDHMDGAAAVLFDPSAVVLAWGAGACAWALCQVLPVLIRTAWDLREAARAHSLQAELGRCRVEWDLAPRD